jgi:PUA domain protein
MKDLSVKRRSRLRSKDTRKILAWMKEEWGVEGENLQELESGSIEGKGAYILGDEVIGIEEKGGLLLTLKGILKLNPTKKWITVDMGAVRFLANGADVMAPGITEADPSIESGDLVWVRDERNHRPLCVGRSIMSGSEMKAATAGKAVETLHYVGDPIWNIEV